ncbi:Tetratricopeptide repeat [Oxalobacteraceae bacterium]
MSIRFPYRVLLTVFCLCAGLSGCATRYVQGNPSTEKSDDMMGDVVISQAAAEYESSPPVCLGLMPLTVSNQAFAPVDDVRKAFHAHLAPTGIRLISLQKIDALIDPKANADKNLQKVAEATQCDTLITGEVTDRKTRFWGVYSEVRAGAHLKIIRASTGKVIWDGRHTAVMRDGGVPLNPVSLVGGVVSAGVNLRDEQIKRTVHDLARRLVHAIPQLRYIDDMPVVATTKTVPQSEQTVDPVQSFLTSLESLPGEEKKNSLVAALDGDLWLVPKDRLAIAESLIRMDQSNPRGYVEASVAKLSLSEPAQALELAKKAVKIDASNPDHQFQLGRTYLHLNQADQALPPFLNAVSVSNPKSLHFNALGLAYNQTGRHAMAVAAFTKSLELDKDNPFSLLQLGLAHVGMGDEAEAARIVRKSMIISIAANDVVAARRSLNLFKAMNLNTKVSEEELKAIEERIEKIAPV